MKRHRFDTELIMKSVASVLLIIATAFSGKLSLLTVNGIQKISASFCTESTSGETETVKTEQTNEADSTEATTVLHEQKKAKTENGKYETPEDIIEMQKDYSDKYSDKDKAGTVYESYYITKGATDTFGDIAVKNTTAALDPDFEALLKEKSDLEVKDKNEPVVLIFHTHTTESYLMADDGCFYNGYETKSTDPTRNMVRVGDAICQALDEHGIGYIHDTEIYDNYYNGAYSRSRVSVEKYLEENPSIKIVLDVHRDALYYSDTEHGKAAYEIDGKKAAQIMIISGAEDSGITDFPDWEYNLRFALEIQSKAMENYYGLMKPIFFCPRRYNMNTAHCSLLLEFGTDANTLEEAVYSGYLMCNVLSEIIEEHS